MAWIKSFQELGDHPKMRRAARTLGVEHPQMVGHLHYLWWWAQSYAEDGSLAGYTVEDVADAARWTGDPEAFIDALLNCGIKNGPGFLERDEAGELLIHDWDEYAGKLVERRATERERQRNKRAAPSPSNEDVDATLQQQPQDVDATYAPRRRKEEKKNQKQSRTDSARQVVAAADVPDDLKPFDAVLRTYPGYSPSRNFLNTIQKRYTHLPLEDEAVKATEWLRENRKRTCSTVFVLKWLGTAATDYARQTMGRRNGYSTPASDRPTGMGPAEIRAERERLEQEAANAG